MVLSHLLLRIIFAASFPVLADAAEHRAAQPNATGRPNILFIILDDWGWQHAGAYGCDWVKTPHFDRVAREGVLFANAFTNNPKCSPCRASILTGRNSWQNAQGMVHNSVFPSGLPVYPALMAEAGYEVGLTGKGWGPGDYKPAGFTHNPAGPSHDRRKATPPTRSMSNNDYASNFEEFLRQRPAGRPFCFWMGFHEPHRPYVVDSGIRSGRSIDAVRVPPYLPDNPVVRGDLLDYALEVEYADSHIGRALGLLEEKGELENTLVVVTSDHGMPFPRVKGQIFEDGFRLPLAARWGRVIAPGRVVEDMVNVRDFAPTFLALAGVKPPVSMTGRSLDGILRSRLSGLIERERVVMLIGKERHDLGRPNDAGYPVRAIRTPDYLYILNYAPERWPAGNPETDFGNCDPGPTKEWLKKERGPFYEFAFGFRRAEMLYKMPEDRACIRNLADDPAHAKAKQELRARLEQELRDDGDPRQFGKGEVFDTYPYVAGRGKAYDTWLKNQNAQEPGAR